MASSDIETLVARIDTLETRLAFQDETIEDLNKAVVEQWKQNIKRFPRGVDIILATADGVACLPRTTRIKTIEA